MQRNTKEAHCVGKFYFMQMSLKHINSRKQEF